MQDRGYEELERRAARTGERDEIRQMEARSRVHSEIQRMRESGEAHTLTQEEEELLLAFRAFKQRTKDRLFTWMSHKRTKGIAV